MDCYAGAATTCVLWEALPVPYFGNVVGERVGVATVGLNPSWTEFLTPEGTWREAQDRLPAVTDFKAQNRGEIKSDHVQKACAARDNYFSTGDRRPHPWFDGLQGVMRAAWFDWSYSDGTAVHLDLIACATKPEIGKLEADTKATLLKNCVPKFLNTLSKLRPEAWLLLDGRTVFEVVTQHCGAVVSFQQQVGDNPTLEVWRGKLSSEFGGRQFLGWSNPINQQRNRFWLVDWLRSYGQVAVMTEVAAVKLYRIAAEQNDVKSQSLLGFCYRDGRGVVKDDEEAVKWFRKAAEQNNPMDQYILGSCYQEGRGVVKDVVEAMVWFRKAAEQNLALAQLTLGNFYLVGQGVAKDELEAVRWFWKAAAQNDAMALFQLGVCYRDGHCVAKDELEAVKWFHKAAEQKDASVQRLLDVSLRDSQGVAKDAVEVAEWYRKGAEQNDAVAQCLLGFCCRDGRGVAEDAVEAAKWFLKAAEQNFAPAQYSLGLMYATGVGVVKDELEAVKWYRKAAEQNDAAAQCCLGVCCDSGQGIAQDDVEAVKWYRKAAEQKSRLRSI